MTTSPRPNFFILLGLNPDATWNPAQFDTMLRDKRNEWSRQGAGVAKKALAAQKNLSLIDEIKKVMSDPALREQEAVNARTELASGRKARQEQFERQLALFNAKEVANQAEVDKFADTFKDVLPVHAIRQRITVKIVTPGTTPRHTVQPLDNSQAKTIEEHLQLIHMNSLYELLQCPTTTAASILHGAAKKLYDELVVRTPKTPEVTAQMTLAGLARDIFRSEDMRARYDETLRRSSLTPLFKELDESVNLSTSRDLPSGQVQHFLLEAQKKGWKEEEALELLKNHVHQRKWTMTAPAINPDAQQILCPNCEHLNNRSQRYCTSCKQPLSIACPDCGQQVSCEYNACGNCGFPVGNRYYVDHLLEEFPGLLQTANWQRAEIVLNEAEAAWRPKRADERTQKLQQSRAEITRLIATQQESQKKVTGELQRLLQEKQFLAARQLLTSEKATIPNWESRLRAIESTITQAQELVRRALATGTSRENKIELCRQALVLCTDYREAQELLKTMPPSPPGNLKVRVRGTVVSLTWQASASRGTVYKIVRKGRAQPNSPTDGIVLDTVTGLTYDDSAPEIGLPLYYAVFAAFDSVTSDTAALLAQPILLIDDVSQPAARVDDQCITLSWEPPAHVHRVILVRKEKIRPGSLQDGIRLTELDAGQKQFFDRNVQNGLTYYYGIYSQFRDVEGNLVTSPGVSLRATPEAPPSPVSQIDITETIQGTQRQVCLSWQPPEKGQVIILKSSQSLQNRERVLPEARLHELGQRLESRSNTVTDLWEQSGVAFYTAVVLFQRMAYLGASQRYACVENVSSLRYQNLGSSLRLQWSWPANCQEVCIYYSLKDWPQPGDSATITRQLSRAEYEHRGYYDIRDTINQDYYVVVAAVSQRGNERVMAQGVRLLARLASKAILTYEIKNPSMLQKKRRLHIIVEPARPLPVMLLVTQQGRLPFRRTDGKLWYRIEPEATAQREVVIDDLPTTKFPPRTFAKLFLEDDSLYGEFTVHHPSEDKLRLG